MKIAILDDYADSVRTLDCFAKLAGHDVLVLNETLDEDALAARLADREGLVLIRERTPIPRSLIERLPALRVISQTGRAGTHVDASACAERGVKLVAGTGSPHAPAELTFALILACAREIASEYRALREGRWQTTLGTTLRGRTLGVLGYGNIGRLVAGFGRAFGMQVLAHGRDASAARAAQDGVPMAASQRELFARADVVTVHVKLGSDSRGMIGAADFAAMRPGSMFVNTSRAGLVAPGALLAGLDAGRPARAALDVFEHEPAQDDPLVRHPRVLAVPHIGYVERDSYEAYFGQAFDNLLAAAAT
ncbi:MAG: D-2-hydroxyacid dehydrogenase family protein [Burkholderiales bacterium]|jgi:D-3-phosphoglycerate dehydrogenase